MIQDYPILFYFCLYIAFIFLNRTLNFLSVKYFNDAPFPMIWFTGAIATVLYFIYFLYEINKNNRLSSDFLKWFTGDKWFKIEGWTRISKTEVMELPIGEKYVFLLNHDSFSETTGSFNINNEMIFHQPSKARPNVPYVDQITHIKR